MKRLLSAVISVIMLITMLSVFCVNTYAADTTEKTVYFSTPAIFADALETVKLTDYSVMFDASNLTDAENVKWSSDSITITNNTVTPDKKGVYTLTATSGRFTKTVYLVVKEKRETEYVLYEMDFSSVESFAELEALGYTVPELGTSHSVSVADGKLKMVGNMNDGTSRVMLPYWLADFGDYEFEADIAMTAKQQSGRYFSMLFRVQNENAYRPYYVYTVRDNATASNGIELCYRNASNTWSGTVFKASHTEGICDSKVRTYTLKTSGSYEEGMIDGKTVVKGNYYSASYGTGGLGLLVRGVAIEVSGVRVTLDKAAVEKLNTNTVRFATPALLADTGDTITLTDYNVMFSKNIISEAKYITWSSDDLAITNNKVTPAQKGVYKLTAAITSNKAGTFSKTVYVVVKDPDEAEYVLFDIDYSDYTSLSDLEALGLTVAELPSGHTVSVKDGMLDFECTVDDASNARVFLPAWLGDFGNYTVSTNLSMSSALKAERYFAIMYRTQTLKNNYPTYVYTVRANPTTNNGCELNYRRYLANGSLGWGSALMAAYTERIDDGIVRNYTLDVFDNNVKAYIDGDNIFSADYISAYAAGLDEPTGKIGYIVRGANIEIASTRVTLKTERDSNVMVDVNDPESNISVPASMITYINSEADLDSIKNAATAVLRLDKDLNVVDAQGSTVTTLTKALAALDMEVIPAFYVSDSETASSLTTYLKQELIYDLFVISDNAEILKSIRAEYKMARAVLDFSDKEVEDLYNIRKLTNESGARVCILPTDIATKANVEYLQRLFITVWTKTASDTPAGMVKAITTGVNGIITQNVSALAECYTKFFTDKTLVRTIGVIGHQGVYYLAQPNTVKGSQLAYELGATAIENDIHLTKDGVIVAMHNDTIDSATNGTGAIADMTLEQLRQYKVDSTSGVDPEPISTLSEYFDAFKGLDVQLIVEIKSTNLDIVDALKTLIEEYDIADQVNVISFNAEQLIALKKAMPEISVGYLTNKITASENEPESTVFNILGYVSQYDSTYNPSYSVGPLGVNTVTAASHRGITVWPYTIDSKADLSKYMFSGVGAITTNHTEYFSDCIREISTDSRNYLSTETEIPVTVNTLTYDRTEGTTTDAKLVFVDGDNIFSYENGKLVATGEGSATLMFSYECTDVNGNAYNLVTETFTATVEPVKVITGAAGPKSTYSLDLSTGVLTVEGTGLVWSGVPSANKLDVKEIVFAGGITEICDMTYSGYYNIKKVTLPEGIKVIGNWNFYGTKLTEISLPSTLTKVGDYAFGNSVLESVEFADTRAVWNNVTIGQYNTVLDKVICKGEIFDYPTETTVWVYDGVDTIYLSGTGYVTSFTEGNEMIPDDIASKIKHVVLDETIAGFGAYTFANMPNLVDVTGGENMRYVGNCAFKNCKELTTVEFTSAQYFGAINYGAFMYCESLESITLSEYISVIYGAAFRGCISLKEVVVPAKVETIGEYVFWNCTGLETLEIKGAKTLGAGSVQNCTALKSVILPDTLLLVGGYAFYGANPDMEVSFNNWDICTIGVGNSVLTNAR